MLNQHMTCAIARCMWVDSDWLLNLDEILQVYIDPYINLDNHTLAMLVLPVVQLMSLTKSSVHLNTLPLACHIALITLLHKVSETTELSRA